MLSSTHDDENKIGPITSSSESDADAPSIQTPPTNVAAASTTSPLHIVDDVDDLPLPIGMAENISNATEPPKQIGNVELIDADDDGPALPPDMMGDMFDDSPTKMAVSSAAASIELVNELSPPTPFNVAEFEDGDDDALTKKIAREEDMNKKPAAIMSDEDSIHFPTRQDIEGGDILSGSTNRGDGNDNRRGWGNIESRERNNTSNDQGGGIRSQTQEGNIINTGRNNTSDPPDAERESTIRVPEAWAVTDDVDNNDDERDEMEVFVAKPLLPWWEQEQTKLNTWVVLCLFSILFLIARLGISSYDKRMSSRFEEIWVETCMISSIVVSLIGSLIYIMGKSSISRHFVGTKIEGLFVLIIMALWVGAVWIIMDPLEGLAQMWVGRSGEAIADYQISVSNANLFYSSWASLLCSSRLLGMFIWERWGKRGGMGFSYTSKWCLLVTASGVIIAECMRFENQACPFNRGTEEANCVKNTIGMITGK